MKLRDAWKLMVLKCFIILYAQVLSCFENRDIQDLTWSNFFSTVALNNVESEEEVFALEFSGKESHYGDSDDEDI